MQRVKNLVVGAGLSGAILAERLASQRGEPVLVIDSRDHIAGMMYDVKHSSGITVQRYGPHIFHTNNPTIWNYLSQFTSWQNFCSKPKAWVQGAYVNFPVTLNTIEQLFPADVAARLEEKLIQKYGQPGKIAVLKLAEEQDPDLKFLADFIYKKFFEQYTTKQWGLDPHALNPEVLSQVPIHISREDGYFHDTYQAIPARGYTCMVENMLRHPFITVQLNTSFSQIKDTVQYDRLFYTGPIDEFFDYRFGELPYRSLRFEIEQKQVEYYQPTAVVNYPNGEKFTRICEHKYFLDEKAPSTVISVEFPQAFKRGENEPYYPIPIPQSAALYAQYLAEAKKLPGVYFLGRLGAYKYCNMDQAATAALDLFDRLP